MPQICLHKVYSSSETATLCIQEDYKSYNKYQKRKGRTKKALLQIPNHQLMDLKVDYAFKQLFGNEKNKDITVVFLNAILAKSGRSPIQHLIFQNIEIGGEYEGDKKSRLDIFVETENKERVNIEIQINNKYNMINRALYYWSRLFSEQLKEGQSYKELYPVISINIMHFNLLHDTDSYHNIFRLHEIHQKYPLTDMIEFHFVEIPKLITAWKKNQLNPWEDVLTRWLLLLGVVDRRMNHFYDDIFQELEEIAMEDKSLNIAMRVWEDLSRTKEERREYEIRLKQILDEQSMNRDRELLEQEMQELKTQKDELEIQKDELETQKDELETQKDELKAEKDEAEIKRKNGFLMRVTYYKKRIAVEFFHSVTDGTGALEFIKALIYHYLLHLGEDVSYESTLINIHDEPSYYERDDSYQNYVTDEKPQKFKEASSYQIRGGLIDQTIVIHGKMSAEKVHKLAKKHGTTITAFISALIIAAIYKERLKFRAYQEEIKIAIPVNLRNLFPSNTLRNFFGVVNIGMAVTETTTLEEIISEVSKQLREKVRKESLQQSINDRVKWQTRLTARFIPLPLKYHAIRYGYRSFSERTKAMTMTNVGKVQLPEAMKSHISHMEIILYPSKKSPINGAMIAVGDELVISFSRMIKEADIIRTFFRELSKTFNLEIEVYSNDSR